MLRRLGQVFPARLSMDALEEGIIPSLDGLRGIAILLVVGFHYLRSYFPVGWVGVDLFFVLSGFLITRILLLAKGRPHYFRNFYVRRVLRIFPLYFAFLLLLLFLLPLLLGTWYDDKVAYYLKNQAWFWTYLENWLFAFRGWGGSTLLSHFWSLAIEEQFYLFWPLLVFFMSEKTVLWTTIFLIAASLLLRNLLFGMQDAPLITYTGTFSRMDALGVGALVAILARRQSVYLEKAALPAFLICILALLAGIGITQNVDYRSEFFVRGGYIMLAFFFGSILVFVLSNHKANLLKMLCSWGGLRWLGKYSYGLYVIHYPAYYLAEAYVYRFYPARFPDASTKVGIALAGLMITIPLALWSYRFLELPFLKLKAHFISEEKPTAHLK